VKVLVVDDDQLLRQMLDLELRRAGYEVVTAADGQETWELLQRERIRMLVVDWMMPGVDGLELVRRIRAAGWPGYTYIVTLTAKDGRTDVLEGLNLGADDYVTKPFRTEELVARLGVGARILDVEGRLKESLAREEALATLDSLTGLPNRRALSDRGHAELSRAARDSASLSLIMLDLDHFKSVNDRFGHAAGDECLRRVAEVLQGSQRAYDYSGRWGGEEFLVIVPGASVDQACLVAERIRSAVESLQLRVGGSEPIRLRASLGVATASPATAPVTLDELVKRADEALYQAKAGGRNQFSFHSARAET
jgi:diguanylate cyclase (GGDEF)-like protein